MKKLLTVAVVACVAFAAEGYKVLNKIKIGGTGGWDYCSMDSAARRLYVSHTNQVEVVDVDAGKVVGTITDLQGVHGIALAPALNKGFISNGRGNNVTVFDLKTLQKVGDPVATGRNPDAICFEPKTQRVFTFNGGSNDSTAIDTKTNAVVGTFPVGGKPEFCVADGTGKMYANIEDKSEVVEIDASKPEVTRRVSILPCEGPSGLAIDVKSKVLFSVCDGKMAVTDYPAMKVVGTLDIGQGPDAAGYDPGTGLAFSSNGAGSGTLSVVKKVSGKWELVESVPTEGRARTMAVDEKLHRVYLLTAEFGPTPEPKEGQKKGRPPVLPDSFHVLVVGK